MKESAQKLSVTVFEAFDPSDEELIAGVLGGDDSRFEDLFLRHRVRVTRIATRFFNRSQIVEEVVQDVFAKAFFALDNYSKDRGPSFAAWISRIAINVCYDELRRARRRPGSKPGSVTHDEALYLFSRLADESGASAESDLISRDLAEKLLSRLGANDRLILTLLDGEEMPVAEIASTLGWGVSRVKVRAHRARAALRRILADFI